jgi:hypothetical protein
VAGRAAGDLEESAAQRASGADGGVGESEQLRAPEQVVGQGAEYGPRCVGVEVAGREVRQRLVLEIADDLLDDGVIAVLGLDERDVLVAVGDQREVSPVGHSSA